MLIISFLIALILTIIIETTLSIILGVRDKIDIIDIILTQIITNPIINLILLFISSQYRIVAIVILELLVIIVESLIYKKYLSYKKINPFLLSIILNVVSYTLGVILLK